MTDPSPRYDLVVVLPGITGSTLYRRGVPIWEPSAGAIIRALLTLGGSLKDLALPEDIGDNPPDDGVTPAALAPDLHVIPGLWAPIKGYTDLLDRLTRLGYRRPTADGPGNLLPIAYDWRLSNRYTADWIAPTVQRELGRWRSQGGPYADAQVVFVAHSMGGLIARWYATHAGADHTRKIVTFGTPMRGSMNAVDQLVNGAPRRLGALAPLITTLGRTLPSLHQLLPSYACVATGLSAAGEPDYLDPTRLPGVDTAMATDGLRFHQQLEAAEAADSNTASRLHAIIGFNQPTHTTMRLDPLELLDTYAGAESFGDATVPRPGAVPRGVAEDANTLHWVPDQHGNLQRNTAALDHLEGVLTAKHIRYKAADAVPIRVAAPELISAGEPLPVTVTLPPDTRAGLQAILEPDGAEASGDEQVRILTARDGTARATFADLPPGAYTLTVHGGTHGSPVAPVTKTVLVWDPKAPMP